MAAPTPAADTRELSEVATTVALMARIGACYGPSFSPDGSRLAFISNLTGIPQVWTVSTEGGWPRLVTALDDPAQVVRWSPAGDLLAVHVAPGGGMNTQIYLCRPDGTEWRRITDGGADNNWLNPWTHDGRALAISSSRRRPEAMESHLYDVASGELRLLIPSTGIGSITDISRDGRYALRGHVPARGDSDVYLVDVERGTETRLTPHEGTAEYHGARFSPDGRTVYLSTNESRDLMALARIRVGDGREGPLEIVAERPDAELQSFEIDEDGRLAALLWNVSGRDELSILDLQIGEGVPTPWLPREVASNMTFSPDGGQLALGLTGAAAPMDIWILDHAAGRFTQVTHSPHPGVDLATLVQPELVRFTAHDGLELSGWLYRPTGDSGPGPMVLSFHGGPEGQEQPILNSTYQALLRMGIGVFAPNVRGSAGFGKRFVDLDNGPLRFDAIRDIKACVEYVVGAGAADPGRIGIMGGSYGGYMAMAGLVEYPDLFAAGANLFGIVNFETFFAHTEPWMAEVSKVEYGDPDTEVEMLRELSPLHRIDRVTAPTIVLHGANDTNVPVVEAEQVVASLRRRNVPVEYVLFPDEGHGWRKLPNRIQAAVAIVGWFTRHL